MGVDFADLNSPGGVLDFLVLDRLSRDHRLRKQQMQLLVHWPGGQTTTNDLPTDAREIIVTFPTAKQLPATPAVLPR